MITFKAKPVTVYNMDDSIAYQYVKVPKIKKSHCNMAEFRKSKKYGPYANSDLFLNLLSRELKPILKGKDIIRLDDIPDNVSIDSKEFLSVINIEIPI